MSKDMNWNVDEIHLKDYDLPQLPDSPICPILVKLFLNVPRLAAIPPTFFEHMPMLEVLDLSSTNIVSLPTSISSLSLLQEFFLRDCSALMELPTHIGMLSKLKLFDSIGTEIMFVPNEMCKLKDLEVMRFSLSQYAKDYIKTKIVNETVIPRKMISELKKLKELWISVCPEAEWWEEEVKDIQNELCDLENLESLRWYLPTNEVLHQFLLLEKNHSPIYANLDNFVLTIGQHAQLTSCLPRDLGKKFEELKKCLKWVNAEGNIDDIYNIMASSEALFLSRHWTIEKLSAFNVSNLKYCLLAECNEMETLVEADGLPKEVEIGMKNSEKVGFELLQYLSIHHMNKLKSIWKGPIGEDSLSKLTILALHACTQLTSIFTPTIAQNLSCLTELIIEDCPKVRSLISNESHNIEHGLIFPSLERIFLLDLPELVNLFSGRIKLENLRTLLIYNCLKLQLSDMELPHIKKIEGGNEWWNDLDCDKSRWENIFVPLKKKRDLVEQLFEATNSLEHFHDTLSHEYDEKKSSDLTDIREQVVTAHTSMEKEKGTFFPPEESKDNESCGWSHSEVPGTESDTEVFYPFTEVPFSLSRQESEDEESYGSCHSEIDDFYSRDEAYPLLHSGQENDERKSSDSADMGEVITADTSMEKGKAMFLLPEGGRTLGVAKTKWQDTLKSTWKAITKVMPQVTTPLSNSVNFQTHGEGIKSGTSEELLIDSRFERVRRLEMLDVNVGGGAGGEPPPLSSKPSGPRWSGRHQKRWSLLDELKRRMGTLVKEMKDDMRRERLSSPSKLSQCGESGTLGEKELEQMIDAFIKRSNVDMGRDLPHLPSKPPQSESGGSGKLRGDPSLGEEEVDGIADEFIKKFYAELRRELPHLPSKPTQSESGGSGKLREGPSLEEKELDQRAEAFIKDFERRLGDRT